MERTTPASPGSWRHDAACRGHTMMLSTFNASTNRVSRQDADLVKAGLALCRKCPVIEPCEDWALSDPDPAIDMIAGGFTPRDRRQIRLGRR